MLDVFKYRVYTTARRQREEMTTGLLTYSTTKKKCISPKVFMDVKFTLIAFEEGKRQT